MSEVTFLASVYVASPPNCSTVFASKLWTLSEVVCCERVVHLSHAGWARAVTCNASPAFQRSIVALLCQGDSVNRQEVTWGQVSRYLGKRGNNRCWCKGRVWRFQTLGHLHQYHCASDVFLRAILVQEFAVTEGSFGWLGRTQHGQAGHPFRGWLFCCRRAPVCSAS